MTYTMRQAARIIEFAVLNPLPLGQNRVIYLEGDPGLGKTALAQSIYQKYRRFKNDTIKQWVYWRRKEVDKVVSLIKPTGPIKEWEEIDNIHHAGGFTHFVAYVAPERDVMDWGLPFPSADRLTVDMLPLKDFYFGPDDRPFIMLDELDKAVQMMQNMLGRLMHERRIGNIIFPDTSFIMAAGNPMASKAGSLVSNTHIKNRRTHVPLAADAKEWIEDVAIPWNLHPAVISYLRTDPDMIHKIDPQKPASPSPRSWTKVAMTLEQGAEREVEQALIEGDIGVDTTSTFDGHLAIYRNLRPIEQIVAAPDRVAIPTGNNAMAIMYAELTALARNAKPDIADAICRYFNRLPADFSFCGYRDMMQRDRNMVLGSRAGLKWATDNADMLNATAGSGR